jgi:hypothetical protein
MSDHYLKSGRSRTLGSLILFSILVSIAVFALSNTVSAAPFGALIVSGIVYDEAGDPLDAAHVVVTDTNTLVSDTYDTGSDGFYYTSIPGQGGWDVGDTIRVVATFGEGEANNTGIATAQMEIDGMEVDVHFGTAIPQLGSTVGMAVAAGLVGVVAVVAVGVRRR